MNVSKEELLHISNLADLKIKDDEIEKYIHNLEDILNYTEILDSANLENCCETIGTNKDVNVFRKDEVKEFKDIDGLMQNAPDKERGMFKIPKVIQ